jgi:transposase
MGVLIEDMWRQWCELDRRIAELDNELAKWARNEEAARRLMTVPGIGVLNATALIAAIGRADNFARGRDLAAWLGLVSRQVTTGGKPRLVGISKRGNKYLRKLLIHGARAALPTLLESATPLAAWLRGLVARMHKNAAVVALANKLARIAWAVLRHNETFRCPIRRRHNPNWPAAHHDALIGLRCLRVVESEMA